MLLLGDPCQDVSQRRGSFREVADVKLAMPLFSFIFDILREVEPTQLRQLARFLNSELPSARIRPRVAGLLNQLMYDHILVQPPFTTAAQTSHTWLRRGPRVLLHGQPLFPPVQRRESDITQPQLVWINVPPLCSRTGSILSFDFFC